MAKTKKVDVKKVQKMEVNKMLRDFFEAQGLEFTDGLEFGMTEGTIVLHTPNCDVQIKLITPKTGLTRYEKVELEEEEV